MDEKDDDYWKPYDPQYKPKPISVNDVNRLVQKYLGQSSDDGEIPSVTIYDEGRLAASKNQGKQMNPYDMGTREWKNWEDGWITGERDRLLKRAKIRGGDSAKFRIMDEEHGGYYGNPDKKIPGYETKVDKAQEILDEGYPELDKAVPTREDCRDKLMRPLDQPEWLSVPEMPDEIMTMLWAEYRLLKHQVNTSFTSIITT